MELFVSFHQVERKMPEKYIREESMIRGPKFVVRLRSHTVFENSAIKLFCSVEGYPTPHVKWWGFFAQTCLPCFLCDYSHISSVVTQCNFKLKVTGLALYVASYKKAFLYINKKVFYLHQTFHNDFNHNIYRTGQEDLLILNVLQVQGWCHLGHFLWKVLCGEQCWIPCPHHPQVIHTLQCSFWRVMQWQECGLLRICIEQNEWQNWMGDKMRDETELSAHYILTS